MVRLAPATWWPVAVPPMATASSAALPSSRGVKASVVEPLAEPFGTVMRCVPATA